MPLFDSCVPKNLLEVQKWFGNAITHPLIDNEMDPKSALESAIHISPSPTLDPRQRIQIYNQQYWWRLLSILQESCPCALRLFGYEDFDQSISVPYLRKYPPHNWSLNTLGDHLLKWIAEDYVGEDKQLVYDAVLLDQISNTLFFKPSFPPITAADEDLNVKPLYLQPHVAFLQFPYGMVEFRKQLIKQEPSFWLDNPFPELIKNQEFILLFRNLKGRLVCKNLTETEWNILKLFQKGSTIDAVCEWIERSPEAIRKEAEQNLQGWFGNWTIRGLFHFVAI